MSTDQNNPYQQGYQGNYFGTQIGVPNAQVVLILGICSIVICALGPILATITLILSSKARKEYAANPAMYTADSYRNLSAGRTCGIIGLCTGILTWMVMIVYFIYIFWILSQISRTMDGANHF